MQFLINNWFYILFGGLMIFMMVKGGGCCGGHTNETQAGSGHSHGGGCCGGNSEHNHNDQYSQQTNQINTVIDPICGMNVDPGTAIKQTINGQTYFFCSDSCRREFVKKQNL